MGTLKNLDTLLEGFITDDGPAGAGLRVYRGEEVLYDRCIGWSNAEEKIPFAPDTICQLASMTKCISVTAGMQLYEKGLFLLTDPVEYYIPEFANRQVYDVNERGETIVRPAKRPVTVGNLFDMTSGITFSWGHGNENSRVLKEEADKLKAEGKYTLKEYAKLCGRTPGLFDPGDHFYYGDSHDMVAALIETLTGKKFSEYLSENIFQPLGMKDMGFSVPESKKDRAAVVYELTDEGRKIGAIPSFFFVPEFESACGGLYGTLEDYSRFARCMTLGEWNGVRLLGDKTIRLMAMNRLCPTALQEFTNPYLAGYGYGLGVRTRMDPAAGSNSSIGEFGWTGAWGSWVLMDPTEKISIVYFQESMPNREEYIHPRIRNIVYSAL